MPGLGVLPPPVVTRSIKLPVMPEIVKKSGVDQVYNPFASILPVLMSLPTSAETKNGLMTGPTHYLIAKGLLTIQMKTVEKAWNLEYTEMEDFLPGAWFL